jgi:beta-1,4-mannosyl-glycoprotein beta-1,4-N-acetylglucosaminyltransferase
VKIYDCFPLFNELDLLHIRLELLYNYVDYFVISECDSTFSGLDKPFNFELNRNRYKKYENKIIYLQHHDSKNIDIIDSQPYISKDSYKNILKQYNAIKNTSLTDYGKPHWCRDFLHKDYIMLGLDICKDDDIIIFGDLDEIPDPTKLIFDGNAYILLQKNMTYNINKEVVNVTPWYGSIITSYNNVKNNSLQMLRNSRSTYIQIKDAGWHLTNMGGTNRIIEKIKGYGHQEYNNDNTIKNIENNLKNNRDIFNRAMAIYNIDINKYYPQNMITFIKENYSYLIG